MVNQIVILLIYPESFETSAIVLNDYNIDLIKQYHPGVQPTNILMTGDRLDTDILFAKKNNIHSLCVLSGISTEQLIQTCKDDIAPEYYTNSIADLLSFV